MANKIIANNGEHDFIGEVLYVEEGYVYFEVEDDVYHAPAAAVKLIGHMNNADYFYAHTYEG